jgi:hypothetical protein
MELQHCIACSLVIGAPQSYAYAVRATAITANKSDLAIRIATKISASAAQVKAEGRATLFLPPFARKDRAISTKSKEQFRTFPALESH